MYLVAIDNGNDFRKHQLNSIAIQDRKFTPSIFGWLSPDICEITNLIEDGLNTILENTVLTGKARCRSVQVTVGGILKNQVRVTELQHATFAQKFALIED